MNSRQFFDPMLANEATCLRMYHVRESRSFVVPTEVEGLMKITEGRKVQEGVLLSAGPGIVRLEFRKIKLSGRVCPTL